ncbi:uncharacterized protein STEHIDRAFT_68228 [Stereum hirsutum FP-91666 SS1]|uniref:tRNA-splicing endonuclease subunit Sen2 n=1 Tax=Stereum hirsutum (strain FP-91666) TaxID=721885 RepID=R7RZZ9_STEHR|nr:uncharacterized protein STEHIDRAFT_68228 [Stereum hirsutum FP-91666 SS1]EIM80475.1 hypothetical protein STEHIDRAFT_68228 [Stereum hirsutum FP-91666 SS1]
MNRGRRSGPNKAAGRRNDNNRIYAHPLPLLFTSPEPIGTSSFSSLLGSLGLGGSRLEVLNPHCEGVFDPATRSVWVTNAKDSRILWTRGFFGKGNLSRSEPSWLARQVNARKDRAAGKSMTSEEVTAKRRAERKQFKVDRARAIAQAAAEAEAAFREGRIVSLEETKANIPSAATWKPSSSAITSASVSTSGLNDEDEAPLEDVEHLQLTLPEAFFLCWALDCLTVLDPKSMEPMTLQDIWIAFQSAHLPLPLGVGSVQGQETLRPDNPFLINYVFHHHYRSLGWVVKNGIKFCVDYLLYKRGPVFHHAEFAFVLMPVYEDEEDKTSSPFSLPNVEPFTWQWLSTVNRVNSQVQKTLILAYVTIPARKRMSKEVLGSPACFEHYSIREIALRRFIPARMRD